MSNDTPPHACLTGFDCITTIPDPGQNMARSAQIEGGTMTFMSPELLVPQEFGLERAIPTPQADIYAFGLVIFQVSGHCRRYRPFLRILSPGPYGRSSIPRYSAIGVSTPRAAWRAPGKTSECVNHRIFRFTVGFHPMLLG